MDDSTERLLDFWFGAEPETPEALEHRYRRWFVPDPGLDAEIAARFGDHAAQAARGELEHWGRSPRGRLALILLLDQLPRHIHRARAAAFAQDAKALELSMNGIEAGMDGQLSPLERAFFYMPLQHAETPELQETSVQKYETLLTEPDHPPHVGETLEAFAQYARLHRDIVLRFGRFPHRNAALGRASTAAEREFLRGGPSFGQ